MDDLVLRHDPIDKRLLWFKKFSDEPFSGTVIEDFTTPSGDTVVIGKVIKGKNVGLWTYWYKNGQLRSKTMYSKDGVLDGEDVDFYEDGSIRNIRTHVNGKGIGEAKSYYENGVLSSKYYLVDGDRHGLYESFHSNSIGKMAGIYNKGIPEGEWIFFNRDGTVKQYLDCDLKENHTPNGDCRLLYPVGKFLDNDAFDRMKKVK